MNQILANLGSLGENFWKFRYLKTKMGDFERKKKKKRVLGDLCKKKKKKKKYGVFRWECPQKRGSKMWHFFAPLYVSTPPPDLIYSVLTFAGSAFPPERHHCAI